MDRMDRKLGAHYLYEFEVQDTAPATTGTIFTRTRLMHRSCATPWKPSAFAASRIVPSAIITRASPRSSTSATSITRKQLPYNERPTPDDEPEADTEKEVQRFFVALTGERHELAFEVLLNTGLREREMRTRVVYEITTSSRA
jgi:hypothetical protein